MHRTLIAAALLGAASAASAQNIDLANMTGQPLQYMKDGGLDGCGLRIVAVRPLAGDRMEACVVSVNIYVNGSAVVKAIAYAPMSTIKAVEPREVKVASSWIKAPGNKPAVAMSEPYAGDSKLSLLFLTDPRPTFAVLMAQQQGKQIQISVRRSGQSPERILAGEVKLQSGEAVQLSQCLDELLKAMQAAAEKK